MKDKDQAEATPLTAVEMQRGVIKQLFDKELKRLDVKVRELRNKERYEKARDIRLQQLAIESLRATIELNGIAL